MMFSVPQFIDIEDKIAGPLTWRQLLWMIGMGAALLVMFNMFDMALFIVFAVPVVLLFAGLAFYRPNGMPLPMFIYHSIFFMFRPKISVWERPVMSMTPKMRPAQQKQEQPTARADKHLTEDKLRDLADLVNSRGMKG
jgi:hypothetical protein